MAVILLLALWNREALFGPVTDGSAAGSSGSSKSPVAVTAELDPDPPIPAATGAGEGVRRWIDAVGSPPVWPDDLSHPVSCEAVDRARHEVCAALDARTDPSVVRRTGGACNLFQETTEALLARPPTIDSELRSYEAILANVFHAFRVLGRERLGRLKETLAGRDELLEPLALTTYRWLVSGESCARSGSPAINIDALYDYAGFAFNTMGGQAYLRRRAPRTEALACFYALQLLDLATERKHNPQGLDPRNEIRRCRELVGSQPLVFADHYVRTLDEMSGRWETKGDR